MSPLGPGALASCTEEHQLLSRNPVSSMNYSFSFWLFDVIKIIFYSFFYYV